MNHYTLTVWYHKDALQEFIHSATHLKAMQQTKRIASEVNTYTIEMDHIPTWKEAKQLLKANQKK